MSDRYLHSIRLLFLLLALALPEACNRSGDVAGSGATGTSGATTGVAAPPSLDFKPGSVAADGAFGDHLPGLAPPTIAHQSAGLLVLMFPEHGGPRGMSSNTFVLIDKGTRAALVIDPGLGQVDALDDRLAKLQVTVAAIAVTHAHFDHAEGVDVLRANHPGAKFYCGARDVPMLGKLDEAARRIGMRSRSVAPPDVMLEGGETINVGAVAVRVLASPGHTSGGMTFYVPEEKIAFGGDTLFLDSIGRLDLPGATKLTVMLETLAAVFGTLPDDVQVFPGHGASFLIANAKTDNGYLRTAVKRYTPKPDAEPETKP